jgi:hypothetical protein
MNIMNIMNKILFNENLTYIKGHGKYVGWFTDGFLSLFILNMIPQINFLSFIFLTFFRCNYKIFFL